MRRLTSRLPSRWWVTALLKPVIALLPESGDG